MNEKIEQISSNLHGTTENLRSLDQMLELYKDAGREQKSAIDKLRGDLDKTRESLREERRHKSSLSSGRRRQRDQDLPDRREHTYLKSPIRGYDSDGDSSPSAWRKRRSGGVRFADDMNRELHSVHQSVRDVSLDQSHMDQRLTQELHRRDLDNSELKRSLRDIAAGVRRYSTSDPIDSSVERRLQTIQNEMRADRHLIDQRYNEVGTISSDLKQALQYHHQFLHQPPAQPQPTVNYDNINFQKQFLETEALKNKVETELDSIKRQLNQSEGGRVALVNQIEDLKSRLAKSEQEKICMKSRLNESASGESFRDRRRWRDVEDERERERDRFRAEIQELRSQLARNVSGVSFGEELRREAERSERQRIQLSEQSESLRRDLDQKEKRCGKLLDEMREIAGNRDESERQRQLILAQFEEALARVRIANEENERLSVQLRMTQQEVQQSEKKREELKTRAQDTVQQWKAKCKKLQQDIDENQNNYREECKRNEQIVKDAHRYKEQLSRTGNSIETLRAELTEKAARLNHTESELRLRDEEVDKLKARKIDADGELRDIKLKNGQLQHELDSITSRFTSTSQEKCVLAEKMKQLQTTKNEERDFSIRLQQDIKDMTSEKNQMMGQIRDLENQKQDLTRHLNECTSRIQSLELSINSLRRKHEEDQHSHQALLAEKTSCLEELKAHHQREMDELTKLVRKEISDYEKDVEMLRIELEKEKNNTSRLRQTDEKLVKELQRLHDQIQIYEEQRLALESKYENLQQEGQSQSQIYLEDLQRMKTAETLLHELKEQLRSVECENKIVIENIASAVDEVISASVEGSQTKYPELSCISCDTPYVEKVVSSIQNKLSWLRGEMKTKWRREKNLVQDLEDSLCVSEQDKHQLLTEIAEKEEKLDQLITLKEELLQRDDEKHNTVALLNDKLKDISDQLQLQKLREQERFKELINVETKETDAEKSVIEDHYTRLKETIRRLREDLRDAKTIPYKNDIV